jgi:lipopolysaccharide transport system permease protein
MREAIAENKEIYIIENRSSWKLVDLESLKKYRDLFYFLAWRKIKVQYAQTVLGLSWAILQPLIQMIIFTIVFGKVAKVFSDDIPYFLFSSVAIIPWTYMSQAMTESSQSLVEGQGMLGKVYFPRLLFPATPVISRLLDFVISCLILVIIIIYYQVPLSVNLLLLPLFVVLMMSVPFGAGVWLSAMAIRFRDVKHLMPFAIRMLIYSAPIVYSASSISDKYRFIYSLNPIVSVIEGFRSCLLGTAMEWQFILPGLFTNLIIIITGLLYFNRMEKVFSDVI